MKKRVNLALVREASTMSDSQASPTNQTPTTIQTKTKPIGFFRVSYFDEMTKRTVKNSPLNWVSLTGSLLIRYEFAACSLQTRGVFVSLLLVCTMQGNAELPENIGYLASLIHCDKRTLKKCIEELFKNSLVERVKKGKKSLVSVETRQKAKEAVVRKGERKRDGKPTFCRACENSGEITDAEFNVKYQCKECA